MPKPELGKVKCLIRLHNQLLLLCSSRFIELKGRIRDKERYLQKYEDTDGSSDNHGLPGVISLIISLNSGSKRGVEYQPQPDCCSRGRFRYLKVQCDFTRHGDFVLDPDGEDDAS
jgi:hypothetical protein